jgi:hypothetical protein
MSGQSSEQLSSLKIIVLHFLRSKSGKDRPADGCGMETVVRTPFDHVGTGVIATNFK